MPSEPPTDVTAGPGKLADASAQASTGTDTRVRMPTLNRPNKSTVMMVVFLTSDLMFFAGLFGIYFTAKAVAAGPWPPVPLNVGYALALTGVLVAASVTCQIGVTAASRGDRTALRRWYLITLLLGLVFLAGQANLYRLMIAEGTTFSSSSFSTVFFLTTGVHALHVLGALLTFGVLITRTTQTQTLAPSRITRAIVVSYYWHFVVIIWIGLSASIYLIG